MENPYYGVSSKIFLRKQVEPVDAVAYIRVSQEDEHPENQVEAIKEWAKKNNINVISIYVDKDVSGSIPPRERPQYRSMLETAKALNIKLILFYDLSRLSRSLEDGLFELKRLDEEGFEFKFTSQEFLDYITDPLLRKKVISDFLWFAELYREDVRRRTKTALNRLKAVKRLGRPPYPLPINEVKKLLREGIPLTKIHQYLVLNNKICREVRGEKRCMSYQRLWKRLREEKAIK